MKTQMLEDLRDYATDLQKALLTLHTPEDAQRVMELAIGIGGTALNLRAALLVPHRREVRREHIPA